MVTIQPKGFVAVAFGTGCEHCESHSAQGKTAEEAQKNLCDALAGLRIGIGSYLYGEKGDRRTGLPIPETPAGYQIAVVHGADHHGSEYEEFHAIPQGSEIKVRDGVESEYASVEVDDGIVWVRYWEDMSDFVFPDRMLHFEHEGIGYSCEKVNCSQAPDWWDKSKPCMWTHRMGKSEWVPWAPVNS